MNIFITASKSAYPQVKEVMEKLVAAGHKVTPPNGFDIAEDEEANRSLSLEEYQQWKTEMIREDGRIVAANDAILSLNFEKNGQQNYIGGATFLELFKAFDLGKKLYLYNPIPEGMLHDELIGLNPIVLNGDLSLIS
jgi:hypothetical protein